jgi:hypothetical protein
MECMSRGKGVHETVAESTQAINWLFVGPKTTEVMFERHRLERLEGKEYDEPAVSISCSYIFIHSFRPFFSPPIFHDARNHCIVRHR